MGVATRGVKFKFSAGERVLCYEPDPTKAKVLYESKVLDLVVSRDDRGRKVPEYLIHFFGWNSSWDRCVKEEFILPFTDENRELQTKLAKDAALSIKGKRKSKLPPLIKETLAKKICSDSGNEKSDQADSPESSSESDSSEDEAEKEVVINIPDVLKLQLEEDWRCVTKKNKLVKLPCHPNVISILESYVKHFAAKLLCASPPRNSKNGKQQMPDDVQNKLNMCKEAMDGIRVYFDFTLPHLLLYRQEKKQYYTDGTNCSPASSTSRELQEIVQNFPLKVERQNSVGNKPNPAFHSKKEPVTIKTEPVSPVRPQKGRPRNSILKPSPPPKIQAATNSSSDIKPQVSAIPEKGIKRKRGRPRTVPIRTLRSGDKQIQQPVNKHKRQSTSEEAPAAKTSPQPEVETPTPCPGPSTEPPNFPAEMRVTRKSVLQNIAPVQTFQPSRSVERIFFTSGLPYYQPSPARSLASNCKSESNSSDHSTTSSQLVGQQYLINNAGLLQETLNWRLLPQHLYEQIPAAPSLIYGTQHLLRLFVKLPDLISKMSISNRKLQPLLSILEQFLMYMTEQRDQLFLATAYVDSTDDFRDGKVTK